MTPPALLAFPADADWRGAYGNDVRWLLRYLLLPRDRDDAIGAAEQLCEGIVYEGLVPATALVARVCAFTFAWVSAWSQAEVVSLFWGMLPDEDDDPVTDAERAIREECLDAIEACEADVMDWMERQTDLALEPIVVVYAGAHRRGDRAIVARLLAYMGRYEGHTAEVRLVREILERFGDLRPYWSFRPNAAE